MEFFVYFVSLLVMNASEAVKQKYTNEKLKKAIWTIFKSFYKNLKSNESIGFLFFQVDILKMQTYLL